MKPWEALLRLLYPPKCIICEKPMAQDTLLCASCRQYVNHPAPANRCPVCFLSTDRCGCGKRLYYDRFAAPFLRNTPAKRTVDRLKFNGRLDLVAPLAHFMKEALDERNMTGQIDLITFIPMDRKKKNARGYNQAEELALALAELTGLPCEPLLEKYEYTDTLHESPSRLTRFGALLGSYEPIREAIPLFEGKNVLLTDDIVTTGATFNEAAKTLLIFGANSVSGAAAMLTQNKDKRTASPDGSGKGPVVKKGRRK